MLKPKYLRVLNLLEKGGTIKLKGFILAMSEDGKLGYLGQSSQQGEVLRERRKNVASTKPSPRKGLKRMGGEIS